MAIAQFYDIFRIKISRLSNEGVALPFSDDENGILCLQVNHD